LLPMRCTIVDKTELELIKVLLIT